MTKFKLTQEKTPPSFVRKTEKSSPQAIYLTPILLIVLSCIGYGFETVTPTPSCPCVLFPKPNIAPDLEITNE